MSNTDSPPRQVRTLMADIARCGGMIRVSREDAVECPQRGTCLRYLSPINPVRPWGTSILPDCVPGECDSYWPIQESDYVRGT